MITRSFSHEDQLAFAELSGDYNPLHVDPVLARRLLFGAQVVHGLHTLLWAIDCLLAERRGPVRIRELRAQFPKPSRVQDELSLTVTPKGEPNFRLEVHSAGSLVAGIGLVIEEATEPRDPALLPDRCPKQEVPRELKEEQMQRDSDSLELSLGRELAGRLFPNLSRCLDEGQFATLLASSRLIGVRCPGLHSVYSEVNLQAGGATGVPSAELRYEVTKWHPRFNLVSLDVTGMGLAGTLKAFRRPAPTLQKDYATVRECVEPNEFGSQRALVIGGSRGLGEVVAKLLAAGGADCRITYFRGAGDAESVVSDIRGGGGKADCLPFDVLNPDRLSASISSPSHLYYFATPFITSGVKGTFAPEHFQKFCSYYVGGFAATVGLLHPLGLKFVFYPSSVFVEDVPPTMGEYAAAKAAGETLGSLLQSTRRGLTVHSPRLPRMATDQTAGIMAVEVDDSLTTMLGALRYFREVCEGAAGCD